MKTGRLQTAGGLFCLATLLVLVQGSAFADRLQPQVQIETKIIEMNKNTARDLGFATRLAQKLATLPPYASFPAGTNLALGPTPSANAIGALLAPNEDQMGTIKLSGLLTGPQTQILIDTVLVERSGKVMSPPVVRTHIDQKSAIDIGRFHDRGLVLEVTPRIGPDGKTISLTLVPQVENLRKAASTATMSSGETMVFGGFPIKDSEPNRNLILLVTPQLVDVLSHSAGGKGPDKIKVEAVGTGETIGHVADLKIQNLTDEPLDIFIPSLILESKSGKDQDYVCPDGQTATIASRQTETVHLNGVCLNRDKPPVGKGMTGALVINTVDPGIAQHPDCHIPAKSASSLLRISNSVYAAVDEILKDGALKDFPYKDEQEQENILVQWSTWTNPQICEIAKTTPATKDDLKKVAYRQTEEKGPMTSDTKKKIDKGINTIFEAIEVTGAKAKDLENPAQSENQPVSPAQNQ